MLFHDISVVGFSHSLKKKKKKAHKNGSACFSFLIFFFVDTKNSLFDPLASPQPPALPTARLWLFLKAFHLVLTSANIAIYDLVLISAGFKWGGNFWCPWFSGEAIPIRAWNQGQAVPACLEAHVLVRPQRFSIAHNPHPAHSPLWYLSPPAPLNHIGLQGLQPQEYSRTEQLSSKGYRAVPIHMQYMSFLGGGFLLEMVLALAFF